MAVGVLSMRQRKIKRSAVQAARSPERAVLVIDMHSAVAELLPVHAAVLAGGRLSDIILRKSSHHRSGKNKQCEQ